MFGDLRVTAGGLSRVARSAPALLLLVAAIGSIALLFVAVAQRIGVPFALEWQEPAMLEHALRVQSGEPLYVEPGVTFAPFPYPPLFHWVGAAMCELAGPSLLALRLVSVLGLVAVFAALIGSFRWVAGVAAAGWFAALWGWTGFWLDVARVDSLALGLGAVGFALVLAVEKRDSTGDSGSGRWFAAFAGVASAMAVLTKQTQLGLAVALLAALLVRAQTRRAGVAYLVAFVAVLGPTVLWLDRSSSGWFLWTTVDLLRGSPFHGPAVLGFWIESAVPFGLPIVLGLLPMVLRDHGRPGPALSPGLLLGCGALSASAWAARAHEGGFDNTLLPVALASAFACGAILRDLGQRDRARWLASGLTVGATLLMVPLPWGVIPTDRDREAYEEAVARLDAIAGEDAVWQPVSALPSTRSGFVHKMAIVDLAKSHETDEAARLLASLREALQEQRFSAIVLGLLPREGWGDLAGLIEASYEIKADLQAADAGADRRPALTPVTGAPLKPRYVLTPRPR
ncbi:hypothetical protein Poly30_23960 [Planctomycetes bacterium Poly30]|uniref:Uncharacterized protein n=1 Tax=Saltatorellus ferox TaxID=2528018 RepID=A0A518ES04_9BACT|nr:hypothetical protein Poly30_23960 [Planctomycetes bacterium Poly30]